MSIRIFDHTNRRMTSLADARPLRDAFLPPVGFGGTMSGTAWVTYTTAGKDGLPQAPFVEMTEQPGHRGGANRAGGFRPAGALVLEGPEHRCDYIPGHPAFFFKDADGNKWKACRRTVRVRTEAARATIQPGQS